MNDRIPIPDAAAITKVPAGTIRRWIAEERLTSTGKPHRVSVTEVLELARLFAPRRAAVTLDNGE